MPDLRRGARDFNPRTPCGVRRGGNRGGRQGQNFNPRTPCGVRPAAGGTAGISRRISIHAPLAGCDYIVINNETGYYDFNPRTPCGVRRRYYNGTLQLQHFNPRTPCGVRRAEKVIETVREFISIHAPLAGCDLCGLERCRLCGYFNPRTPCGVRRDGQPRSVRSAEISIHAPLAGCDKEIAAQVRAHLNFNPRTPCGVRHTF